MYPWSASKFLKLILLPLVFASGYILQHSDVPFIGQGVYLTYRHHSSIQLGNRQVERDPQPMRNAERYHPQETSAKETYVDKLQSDGFPSQMPIQEG